MGGVCKTQGLIHRALMKHSYWGFHFREGGLQPSIQTSVKFRRLSSLFRVEAHCLNHCMPRVAQEIRAIQTYRGLYLPPCFQGSLYSVPNPLMS